MVEEVVELPLEAIEEDGAYRFRLWLDVRDLVEDIRAHGQDFPVVVRPRGERYQLVCGYRRLAALRQLGATTVKAVVRELDDEAALRLAWSENESRDSYSDVDRAHAILKSSQAGYSLRDMEELFGLRKTRLGTLRKLATLDPVLQGGVQQRQIKTVHAITLNVLKQRYPDLDFARWVKRIAQEGWSLRQLKQRVGLAHDAPRKPLASRDEKTGRLRLRARQFVPGELDAEERGLLIAELEMALAALREASDA